MPPVKGYDLPRDEFISLLYVTCMGTSCLWGVRATRGTIRIDQWEKQRVEKESIMALKLALLASGRGSNAATIVRHAKAGKLDAEVVLVGCNNPEAQVLQTMQEEGIPTWCHSHKDFPDRVSFDRTMLKAIQESGADTIALCGFMRLLSGEFIAAYSGRILNVHPAILPSFPGTNGGGDAYAYGVRFTGCTVHFVIEEMDAGAIIIQGITPILSTETDDDFMPRVHAMEHRIFPQALQWLAEDRLHFDGRRVILEGELPQGTTNLPTGCVVSPMLEKF